MAQYNKQNNQFLSNGTSLFEVVMLADAEGNINSGGGNFSGAAVDAFGRARMSQPVTLFDSTNVGGASDAFYNDITGLGSIQYDNLNSAVNLVITSSATPEKIVRRSTRRMSYQPGKSLLILATFTMASARTGLTQKVGYYDDQDGIYIEKDENDVYNMVRRHSVLGTIAEERIPQSQWNGDKLNGIAEDSTSGFTLDLDKSQISWTDIEWLGVGSVRCGFVINGQFIVAHTFHHANIITGTYMRTASLPVTYEIETDATYNSGSTSLKQICCSVISEGGYTSTGLEYAISTPLSGNSTNNTGWLNLVTAKLSAEDAIAVISGIDVINIANEDFEWGLFRNATFATPLSFAGSLGSLAYDTTDINLATTGTRFSGGYLAGKTAPATFGVTNWEYQFTTNASGPETYTLAVRADSQSKSAAGMIKWIEH